MEYPYIQSSGRERRDDFLGCLGWLLDIEELKYNHLVYLAIHTEDEVKYKKKIIPSQCKLSEMRHHWWVAYRWENVTELQDTEPVYIRGIPRPIEEAESASQEFHLSRVSRVTSEEAV